MFLSCQVWISRSKYLSDFPQFYRNFSAIFPKVISIYFSIFWFLIFFRFSIYRSFLGQFPLGSFSRNFSLRSALVSEGGLTNPPSCLPVQPWPGSKLVRSQGLSTHPTVFAERVAGQARGEGGAACGGLGVPLQPPARPVPEPSGAPTPLLPMNRKQKTRSV